MGFFDNVGKDAANAAMMRARYKTLKIQLGNTPPSEQGPIKAEMAQIQMILAATNEGAVQD